MSKLAETVEAHFREIIEAQHVFFVATAPPGEGGHVNLSPKGCDTLRVLDEKTVAWLDLHGSGIETVAHLRADGRITLMFCRFEGPPKIVRIHGRGEAVEPEDPRFEALRGKLPGSPQVRSVIVVHVERVSDSCGYGVPLYAYQGERSQLAEWSERKGPDGLREYRASENAESIDGLPGLRSMSGAGDG